ncbi:twin arginine-targeting protein translocase, TatA/E family [Providencia rettgeri]|uniref:Twin arginine-targeting protein translocase, TatA/E family n=1 Tax=Providencia rettgeri TaxID=587 RepID=A0A379FLR7_PRORE|nr:twin arginine-targeting protein translocase, TatA/E family [Providencia rettgeri]
MESTIAMAAFGSPWQLIIIALLIILIFGTKKIAFFRLGFGGVTQRL